MTSVPFFTIPKLLNIDSRYASLSVEAKYAYGLMRDRFQLSLKNNFTDAVGTFIYMSRNTLADFLKKSLPTVRKIVRELIGVGLIIEKRIGLTQCNKIYVQLLDGEYENSFVSSEKVPVESTKKPDSVPDRKDFAPSKNHRKQIQFRKLTSKPDLPQNGDIWEENGQLYTYHHGYTQRYYTGEELNRLCFDCYGTLDS